MALRDQPYLPLFVQDLLTDEKLIECSASAHGVYFRLMCILHKQETYGLLCLKQKYKQNESKVICFALLLCRQMPFRAEAIQDALEELIEEKVIYIDGDNLIQKRMLHDGKISVMRTAVGKKGGSNVTKQYGKKGFLYLMSDGYDKNKIGISVNPGNRLSRLRCDLKLPKYFEIKYQIEVDDMGKTEDFAQLFFKDILDGEWLNDSFENCDKMFILLKAKIEAKTQANTEYEIENEYVINNDILKEEKVKKEKKVYEQKTFVTPLVQAFRDFKEMRVKIKKPLTEKAIGMIHSKLSTLAGHDEEMKIQILNQSIMNSWPGVWPLNGTSNVKTGTSKIDNLFDIATKAEYQEPA